MLAQTNCLERLARTLAALGVKAEVNGRNDITIDGKKFSGNSQYIRQGRVMHHGTIMFDSDLSVVSEALRVDPTKIQTKGIRSVRSRVTNVAEHLPEKVTLPEFRRILLENILRENQGEEYPLDRTLESLQAVLPDNDFFRANRQFIVARQAVAEIAVWFGSRLALRLSVETPERIVISKARVPEFKRWLTSVHPAD